MGLVRKTWTAALATAAIAGTGIGVAAASGGPSEDDRTPAVTTTTTNDDGTADQGRGDRPGTPTTAPSRAPVPGGRGSGDGPLVTPR